MTFSCISAGKVTASILLSCLVIAPSTATSNPSDLISPENPILLPTIPTTDEKQLTGEHEFSLRHVFHRGTYRHPSLHKRLDVAADATIYVALDDDENSQWSPGNTKYERLQPLQARSSPLSIQRLADRRQDTIEDYLAEARWTGRATTLSASDWTTDEIAGPDVTDKETVVSLALMSANAYNYEKGVGDWEDVKGGFNHSQGFGWEGDGLRGHIFATPNNDTIVISLKGTSTAVFDGAETTTNDKVNDNLFFSCCCGAGGQYLWRQVCDCYSTTFTCNSTCLVGALRDENRYYRAAIDLYTNVTEIYPDSNVWITGHSLGGSVSSLLGQTFGLPTVTFEAPGDALPAGRLGLPSPPDSIAGMHQTKKNTGVFHFGHTADPVYMGTCNGATSTCTLAGYAMESQCHAGLSCIYDTVGDKGWRVGIGAHRIRTVISDVLRAYDDVPVCEADAECVDCFNWKYFESNGSDSTTTKTTTTSSAIRTQTCKTPGWWGCLDETTTTTTTSTSSSTTATTTATTTTCHTPGWFGCKDPTTTNTLATPAPTMPSLSSTPTATISATSTTCLTPGWFGCTDPSSSSITAGPSPTKTAPRSTYTPTGTTTCTSKEWFGLICVDPSPVSGTGTGTGLVSASSTSSASTSMPSTTGKPTPHVPLPHFQKGKCLERSWVGICKVREGDEDGAFEKVKIEI